MEYESGIKDTFNIMEDEQKESHISFFSENQDSLLIAEKFNNFFADIDRKLVSKFPYLKNHHLQ